MTNMKMANGCTVSQNVFATRNTFLEDDSCFNGYSCRSSGEEGLQTIYSYPYLVAIQQGQMITVADSHFLSLLIRFLSLVKRGGLQFETRILEL